MGRKPPDAPQLGQLQALKPFAITIKTHQAPAIGDRQGRQMGFEQGGGCCRVPVGRAHQLRLAHKPHKPQRGDRAEQHLFNGQRFPVVNDVLVLDVVGSGQRQPDIRCPCVEQLEQGGVAELMVLDGQRPLQSRKGGCGALQLSAGGCGAEPLLPIAAHSCLRVTRSLATRAFSCANSESGRSRVVRMV